MNSPSSSDTTFQPIRMCRLSDSDLYWVAMKMRRSPELMQLLSVKSMIRYGTAEIDRRFRAFLGQRREAFPDSACEQDDEDIVEFHEGSLTRKRHRMQSAACIRRICTRCAAAGCR